MCVKVWKFLKIMPRCKRTAFYGQKEINLTVACGNFYCNDSLFSLLILIPAPLNILERNKRQKRRLNLPYQTTRINFERSPWATQLPAIWQFLVENYELTNYWTNKALNGKNTKRPAITGIFSANQLCERYFLNGWNRFLPKKFSSSNFLIFPSLKTFSFFCK